LRERGEKRGGVEEEERETEVRNGRDLGVLGFLMILCRDLKIAIVVGSQFNNIGLVRLLNRRKTNGTTKIWGRFCGGFTVLVWLEKVQPASKPGVDL